MFVPLDLKSQYTYVFQSCTCGLFPVLYMHYAEERFTGQHVV